MSDWQKELRQRFEEHPFEAPGDLWPTIEAGVPPQKTRVFPWAWTLAGLSVAAAAALCIWVGIPSSVRKPGPAVAVVTPQEEGEPSSLTANPQVLASVSPRAVPLRKTLSEKALSEKVLSEKTVQEKTVPEKSVSEKAVIRPEEAAPNPPVEQEAASVPDKAFSDDKVSSRNGNPQPVLWPEPDPKPFRKRFRAGLVTSGSQGNTTTSSVYGILPVATGTRSESVQSFPYLLSTNSPTEQTVRHASPIRYGITLSWQFAPRWSIETGLLRSDLNSRFLSKSEYIQSTTDRSLHCLGIPLSFRYDLRPPDRWYGIYAGGGFLWEKALEMEVATTSFLGDYGDRTVREEPDPRYHAWSALASLGFQIRPFRSAPLSLYVEPGVAWHFRNGCELETCYDVRPFSLSLNAGLRILLKR